MSQKKIIYILLLHSKYIGTMELIERLPEVETKVVLFLRWSESQNNMVHVLLCSHWSNFLANKVAILERDYHV